MKLFTIGDSISQGFMSFAAARTDLSYSTLIAEQMGLHVIEVAQDGQTKFPNTDIEKHYYIPQWRHIDGNGIENNIEGMPANIEHILRVLAQKGFAQNCNIQGADWLRAIRIIESLIAASEDYYERGDGKHNNPYTFKNGITVPYFHNVAVSGFTVADSWQLTPELCEPLLDDTNNTLLGTVLSGGSKEPWASKHTYRVAHKILNQSDSDDEDSRKRSQLDWLDYHTKQNGVENLLLWLGNNNALGTVSSLNIVPSTIEGIEVIRPQIQELGWNLWHPNRFKAEYANLLKRVDTSMQNNPEDMDWHVFIGTIPKVTIAPITLGIEPTTTLLLGNNNAKSTYFEYYSHVNAKHPEDQDSIFTPRNNPHLTLAQVLRIDSTINTYNKTIEELVATLNEQHNKKRYHVVNLAKALDDVAYKRNQQGNIHYEMPLALKETNVDTRFYDVDNDGRLRQGGLFSLDGVHPSAIGQGLVAYEFLKVMESVGIKTVSQDTITSQLTWEKIIDSDTLYKDPVCLIRDIYDPYGLLNKFYIGNQKWNALRDVFTF